MPLIVSTLHLSTRTQNKCSVQAPGGYNFWRIKFGSLCPQWSLLNPAQITIHSSTCNRAPPPPWTAHEVLMKNGDRMWNSLMAWLLKVMPRRFMSECTPKHHDDDDMHRSSARAITVQSSHPFIPQALLVGRLLSPSPSISASSSSCFCWLLFTADPYYKDEPRGEVHQTR